jgi:O-methyltransferase
MCSGEINRVHSLAIENDTGNHAMISKLAALAKRVADSRPVLRVVEVFDRRSDNRMTELGMLSQAFEFIKINGVDGDYFEFGLWRGKTFTYAHRMKKRFRIPEMMFWGFDSFQGLPRTDDAKDNIWSQNQFACSEPELRKILRRNGFRDNEYRLVPGFYKDSLNDNLHRHLANRHAAIVYVDCDLYTSAAAVLAFIRHYLVTGTIVCFDDFYNYKGSPDHGEQKAVTEFLREHPNFMFLPYLDYSPLGKSFIVQRNE